MYKLDLEETYEYYVNNVSSGNYPISLELARYLYDLCCKVEPKAILDRGSGFSSFVFRKYALMCWKWPKFITIDEHRILDIYTVDEKDQWLDKTAQFLRDRGLKPYNFFTWKEFMYYDLDKKKFDIILEDYSFPFRPKSLPKVIDMVAPGGYLVLDDVHLERYKSAIFKASKRHNINVLNLTRQTKDHTGRHAALIRKKNG